MKSKTEGMNLNPKTRHRAGAAAVSALYAQETLHQVPPAGRRRPSDRD